jgi:hypothetical protein
MDAETRTHGVNVSALMSSLRLGDAAPNHPAVHADRQTPEDRRAMGFDVCEAGPHARLARSTKVLADRIDRGKF